MLGVLFGTIGYFALQSADPNTILNRRPIESLKNAMIGIILVSSVKLVGVLGTLAWKKWGVYVLTATATFGLLLSIKGEATAQAAYGLLALCVFGIAISRHWGNFE